MKIKGATRLQERRHDGSLYHKSDVVYARHRWTDIYPKFSFNTSCSTELTNIAPRAALFRHAIAYRHSPGVAARHCSPQCLLHLSCFWPNVYTIGMMSEPLPVYYVSLLMTAAAICNETNTHAGPKTIL